MNGLEDAIRGVINAHRFDKDGGALIDDLVRFHRDQSLHVREDLSALYRQWLRSEDPIRAGWAIALIRRLELVNDVRILEDVLWAIRDGRSKLPAHFHEFLEPAIEELKRKQPS